MSWVGGGCHGYMLLLSIHVAFSFVGWLYNVHTFGFEIYIHKSRHNTFVAFTFTHT